MQKNATFRPGFLIKKINYAYGSVCYRFIFFDCTRPSDTSTPPLESDECIPGKTFLNSFRELLFPRLVPALVNP